MWEWFVRVLVFWMILDPGSSLVLDTKQCPSSHKKWRVRAIGFECKEWRNETYHCLLGRDGLLYETCMKREEFYPNGGGCPWIHFKRNPTQVAFGEPVSKCKIEGCPVSDNTTKFYTDELFKYHACFIPERERTKQTSSYSPGTTKWSNEHERIKEPNDLRTYDIVMAFLTGVLYIVTILFTVVIICFRTKLKRLLCSTKGHNRIGGRDFNEFDENEGVRPERELQDEIRRIIPSQKKKKKSRSLADSGYPSLDEL